MEDSPAPLAAGFDETEGIVGAASSDNDNGFDLIEEIVEGLLTLLGRLADGVDPGDFRSGIGDFNLCADGGGFV